MEGNIMSFEGNKAIIRGLIKVFNNHNVALLDNFISPDFVDAPNTPFELKGLDSFKKFETNVIKAFPDYNEIIEDIIAEGDKVWVWLTVTMTHMGEWNIFGVSIPPTHKKISYTVVNVWRVVDGKAIERKSLRDMLDFFNKLGIVEYTEKGKKLFPEGVS